MTPNIVPLTFLSHRLCNTDHKTFSFLSLCLAIGFPTHAFLVFFFKSKNHYEKRGFKHCENTEHSSVLVCVFREVRYFVEVWIVNEHRFAVHRSDLVDLVGLITCVETRFGPRSQTPRCSCGVARVLRLKDKQVRQERVE